MASAFGEYLYHCQMAWYLDGAIAAGRCSPDAEAYVVAVEVGGDHDVAALRLGGASIDAGRAVYRHLLDTFLSCSREDVWPGRYPILERFDVPLLASGMTYGEEGF